MNSTKKAMGRNTILMIVGLSLAALAPRTQAQFTHPGCLSTQEDLDRMAVKVDAGVQPWKGSWDILVGNEGFYMGGPEAVATVCVDSGNCGNTYMNLARDSHRAYQCALRYYGSGNTAYADHAVQIMNAWATTHTAWDGNTNIALRAGLYGHAFANAGELMRDYPGWAPADFALFQQYMLDQFYFHNSGFLNDLIGFCWSHYWANWTWANLSSMIAIGVLCDDQAIFDEALNHFYNGVHTGGIEHAVYYVHPNGLGQWQESGRDQGHAQMGPQLLGPVCEIAWNQGYDLYSYLNNRALAGVEYISKYNTWHAVPFVAYANCDYAIWPYTYRFVQKEVAGLPGGGRPGWDLIYNHYVNRMGIAAPYTAQYAALTRPEGGGSNYGWTSGGFDGLGFTTLTHSRDPIASGAVPGTLLPYVQGRQITLSWAGAAYAQSYNVKRSTTSGGPYTSLGTVDGDSLFYVDPGLTAGMTYYYVVSANNPGGESANSAEAAATADGQLFGTAIGSDYSWDHCGATREILFDGSLGNFIDIGESGGGWAGLDLGSGVSAVITGVRYCPRATPEVSLASAMVGGKFQASNTADFSSGVVDLYTITSAPPEGVLTFQAVNSGSAYRYVRYIQPNNNGWNTTAEVQFLGAAGGQSVPSTPVVEATLVNGLQIDLSLSGISGIPGVGGYRIKRSTSPGGPYAIWGDVNTGYGDTTKFSDVETEMDATYYYVVSAYNQLGESADSAEVSVSTLPTGPQLMTHLKMSGNVADSSGYNFYAGTVGSPEYPGWGYVGSAIDLDGVDDFVTSLQPRVVGSDDITVAAWVNWDGGAAWQRIFDFGTGTWSYLYLTPSSGTGKLRFGIKNTADEQAVETSALAVGTWTHVAVTLGGNTATLYVNGSPAASNPSVTINPSDFSPWANYIGKSQWGQDPLFNGRIDEFRVYNYALSAGDVAALAAQPSEMTPPAVPTGLNAMAGDRTVNLDWADNTEPDFDYYTVYRSTTSGSSYSAIASGLTVSTYIDNTVSNGETYYYVVTAVDTSGGESADSTEVSAAPQGTPIAHYKLEGNTLDSSGNGNNATATGSPAYVAGQIGQAIDLDGSDDYVRIPSGMVSDVENLTVAAWVNWDSGGVWQRIFDFGDSTSRYMFLTPYSGGGTLRFAINNGKGEQITETTVLATGTWVHVAVTLSDFTTTLYVNGVAVASNGASINPTGFDFTPVNNYIGKSQFADPLFNGRVDDFRIYDYVLSGAQVADLATNTTPPAVPTGLTATAGDGSVSLNWDDNTEPDLDGYNVYRDTAPGVPYTQIATGIATSDYVDNTVTNGTTYYYVVTAVDTSSNESGNSNEASATPQAVDTDPPTPNPATFAVAPAADSDTAISMTATTGSDPSGPVEYLFTETSGNPGGTSSGWQSSPSYTDTGLTASTQYTYTVTMRDALDNMGTASSPASATTPAAPVQSPYGGTPWAIPGTIEGEDYDTGGEGLAYHDTTAGNSGGLYRSDDVDIETCGEGGYNIGWGADGEWLEYTVDVASAGNYDIVVRAASTNANGRFHIEFDGLDVTGLQSVPNTGNWQTYTDVTISNVSLNAGQQVMRVFMDVGSWNLNNITVNVTGGGAVVVFSDSFENGQWNGLWTQDSQNDWFVSTQRAVDGSYSAEVDGFANNAALTSILIDLQGMSNATVTFSWLIESGLDSGEYLAFDVSTNGGSNWTQMAILQGNVDQEDIWHNESIDVTGIGSGSLQIRFRGSMDRSNEDADVDMVEVTAW